MMAALISHVISTVSSKILANSIKSLRVIPHRNRAQVHKHVKKLPKRYVANAPLQVPKKRLPYTPPQNASEILTKNFQEIVGSTDPHHKLDKTTKYQLLCALKNDLGYSVPNSLLYKMDDLGSVYVFYTTSVDVTNPYDALTQIDTPPNLHVMPDYIRFHPDTDTRFGGVTAFPRSSTIVSSLKWKKRGLKGHDAGNPWNDI